MQASSPPTTPRQVVTVQGPIPHQQLGITDAHNHVWIEPVPGAAPGSPTLDQFDLIQQELADYREHGGGTILDCQPGGCGRSGNKLLELSRASGVHLVACTGFHRKKYYAPGFWLWSASAEKIAEHLQSELEHGLVETLESGNPVRAGFIKIALETTWADSPQAALEGAAQAALGTRALVEIHTEKGWLAEKACIYFTEKGLLPSQIVLCHMDKRPDSSLHKALAHFGVLLEYDTFYRPKYDPAGSLWPLIEHMVGAGFSGRIALATDLAESELYRTIGGGPGLASLPGKIRRQLREIQIPESAQEQMLGGNIARRLAGII